MMNNSMHGPLESNRNATPYFVTEHLDTLADKENQKITIDTLMNENDKTDNFMLKGPSIPKEKTSIFKLPSFL